MKDVSRLIESSTLIKFGLPALFVGVLPHFLVGGANMSHCEICTLLAKNPRLGPARPDLAPDLRYFPVDSYLILYRQQTDLGT